MKTINPVSTILEVPGIRDRKDLVNRKKRLIEIAYRILKRVKEGYDNSARRCDPLEIRKIRNLITEVDS